MSVILMLLVSIQLLIKRFTGIVKVGTKKENRFLVNRLGAFVTDGGRMNPICEKCKMPMVKKGSFKLGEKRFRCRKCGAEK